VAHANFGGNENDLQRAFQISEYLHHRIRTTLIHRYYARMLYSLNMHPQMEEQSMQILQRTTAADLAMRRSAAVHASFFLGQLYAPTKTRMMPLNILALYEVF